MAPYGGLEASRSWHGEGEQTSAHYGYSVGTAGDVNGDGYADVIVGAPNYNLSKSNEGQAFLYYGNGGRGVALRPVQQQEDDRPLAHLGLTDSYDRFQVKLLPESPFGRGGLDIEVEAKPLGVPFDGSNTVRWLTYLNLPDWQAGFIVAAYLVPDMPYHWRVRWLYDPATTPWMPASRWMTVPWNGWQEADLRTGGSRIMLPLVLRDYN